MKTIRPFLLTLAAAAAAGCGNPAADDAPSVDVDMSARQQEGLGSSLALAKSVVLAAPDSLPMGTVGQLQVDRDGIYLSDPQTGRIFGFGPDGHFRFSFRRQGRADNEYAQLTDFQRLADGTLCVYDGARGRLLRYAADGRLLSATEVSRGEGFRQLDELLLVDGGNVGERGDFVCLLYRDTACVARNVAFDAAWRGHRFVREPGSGQFFENRGRLFMKTQSDDTIYAVDRATGAAAPLLRLAFDEKYRPQPVTRSTINGIAAGTLPSFAECLFELGDRYLITYSFDGRPWALLVGPDGTVGYHGATGRDENGVNLYLLPCCGNGKDDLAVSLVPPGWWPRGEHRDRTKERDPERLDAMIAAAGEHHTLLFYRLAEE